MLFFEFAKYLKKLEEISSRIEITQVLSELLSKLKANEIKEAAYLLNGSIGPSYEKHLFNVADKMLLRGMSTAFRVSKESIDLEYKRLGDLGDLAFSLANKHKVSNKKTILRVSKDLLLLTEESGIGSQDKRIQIIAKYLEEMDSLSAKYFIRLISGKLRLGFSERTIIDALSWMETGNKTLSGAILKSFEVVPDIGALAQKIKQEGAVKATKEVVPIIGIPVQPMLCQRLKSPSDMISKMKLVSVEPKFDGLRVLIHYSKTKNILRAFTRNLKDISPMFPELNSISEHINAREIILDSEVVGMDPKLKKILDFQTTMQRRRKHEVVKMQNKIPVTFQVFDVLFKDGISLMEEPYLKRRKLLADTIKNGTLLKVDDHELTDNPTKIAELHQKYIGIGLEGIIVKKPDSTYVPGRLGWRWVKMKEAESSIGKLSDTVDAVIVGYSEGQGKRTSFGIGQFLVGVKDGENIKTICKVGTGLTDELFKELSKILSSIKVLKMPQEYKVHKNLYPDYWVKPMVVVELAADDITVSPTHTAGLALRFPRLVKIRKDKSANEATTLTELTELLKLQKK